MKSELTEVLISPKVQEAMQIIGTVACIIDHDEHSDWTVGFVMGTPYGDRIVEINASIVTEERYKKMVNDKSNKLKKLIQVDIKPTTLKDLE